MTKRIWVVTNEVGDMKAFTTKEFAEQWAKDTDEGVNNVGPVVIWRDGKYHTDRQGNSTFADIYNERNRTKPGDIIGCIEGIEIYR